MLSKCGMEKTLESPSDWEDIKPVNPKGSQPWIFIGRTEAEALIFWPPDEKSWLIGKDPDVGKDWEKENGEIENEMVRWHHQLNGGEPEQTLGDSVGQGNLVCCSPRGCKELKQLTTEEQQYFYHTTFSEKHNFLTFFLFWYRSYFLLEK